MATASEAARPAPAEKFADPDYTADGQPRAEVAVTRLATLWFNTGTLCNLACTGCYIESSPRNDALVYLSADEVAGYLDALDALAGDKRVGPGPREIGFTGGEPFMNPDMCAMIETSLARGHRVLVLSNAMKPMQRVTERLAAIHARAEGRLSYRISLDHYSQAGHEQIRGPRSWAPAMAGLRWLSGQGVGLAVAARTCWDESEAGMRAGFGRLFAEQGIAIDAEDPAALVLFPEMDETAEPPEITTACWQILDARPEDQMCASSRMVVKRKGAARPTVLACTLITKDPYFELGPELEAAISAPVRLKHPHCARFCVLGGASCS